MSGLVTLSRSAAAATVFGMTLTLCLSGCGNASSPDTPTPVVKPIWISETLSGPLGGRAWACMNVVVSAETPFEVTVSPAGLFIEVYSAGCGGDARLLVASDTGKVSGQMPAGENSVRVGNPSDDPVQFSLQISHNR